MELEKYMPGLYNAGVFLNKIQTTLSASVRHQQNHWDVSQYQVTKPTRLELPHALQDLYFRLEDQ